MFYQQFIYTIMSHILYIATIQMISYLLSLHTGNDLRHLPKVWRPKTLCTRTMKQNKRGRDRRDKRETERKIKQRDQEEKQKRHEWEKDTTKDKEKRGEEIEWQQPVRGFQPSVCLKAYLQHTSVSWRKFWRLEKALACVVGAQCMWHPYLFEVYLLHWFQGLCTDFPHSHVSNRQIHPSTDWKHPDPFDTTVGSKNLSET